MPMHSSPRPTFFAALLALAACGGGEGSDASRGSTEAAQAADTSIRALVREPLTGEDLVGLSLENLSVELPWTENQVVRDPSSQAARASIQEVDVAGHEGFDRVIFRFGETTPFPGYRIDILEAGTPVRCGDEDRTPALDEGQAIVVRIAPARASDRGEVRVPVRTTRANQTRFRATGLVCDDGQQAVWVASLAEGDQVRVLEMRAPNRLVVDVR